MSKIILFWVWCFAVGALGGVVFPGGIRNLGFWPFIIILDLMGYALFKIGE